jgi:hypothetical protein
LALWLVEGTALAASWLICVMCMLLLGGGGRVELGEKGRKGRGLGEEKQHIYCCDRSRDVSARPSAKLGWGQRRALTINKVR